MFVSQSLTSLNTLGVDTEADDLVIAQSPADVLTTVRRSLASAVNLTVLGGGSNIVPLARIPGQVLLMRDDHLSVIGEDRHTVLLEVGAGYDWSQLVRETVVRGWYGLENLTLIPGTAGAAPMQNIGAYGVELDQRLHSLDAVDLKTAETREFTAEQGGFGYRTSVFKRTGHWIITRIRLRLCKTERLELGYPEVARRMLGRAQTAAGLADVVEAIRRDKLPDPRVIGNVGSFFKNPVVPASEVDRLRERCPWLQTYAADPAGDTFKLSAAQLIDRAGWKGRSEAGVGVWEKQPLVLVNRGTRRGRDFLVFAGKIRTDLEDRYGVSLEIEPVVLGQD